MLDAQRRDLTCSVAAVPFHPRSEGWKLLFLESGSNGPQIRLFSSEQQCMVLQAGC